MGEYSQPNLRRSVCGDNLVPCKAWLDHWWIPLIGMYPWPKLGCGLRKFPTRVSEELIYANHRWALSKCLIGVGISASFENRWIPFCWLLCYRHLATQKLMHGGGSSFRKFKAMWDETMARTAGDPKEHHLTLPLPFLPLWDSLERIWHGRNFSGGPVHLFL